VKKIVLLIITVLILIGGSGLAYASDIPDNVKAVINKNPHVAKYVNGLLESIQTLLDEKSGLQEEINQHQNTIAVLTASNAEKDTTITSLATSNEQLQNTIANLSTINEDLTSQIQLIDLSVGIYEGSNSNFGYFKGYIVNKEVTFANTNGKKWRVTPDEDGIVRITLPAGKYDISVPGYKSYAFKFIPEESKYGYVYTEAASYSFASSTGIGFWFYDESNLPALPSYP
jgi:uncharacterized protein YoxC